MAATALDPIVQDIEDAFVAHWSRLGRWPGAELVDRHGVLRFATRLRELPYNGVLRTAIEDRPDDVVEGVVREYAERGADFFWLVHPSATPADLPDRLSAAGLRAVESATGMSLDLDEWDSTPPARAPSVDFAEVLGDDGLRVYEDIAITRRELDETDGNGVVQRTRAHRWLALVDGRPVGKAFLSLAGPARVAAIYGMSVRPEARGKGIARGLTHALLRQAKSLGYRRAVLHSSETALGVYRRAGFVERCRFTFFATTPIYSGEH